MVIFPDRTFPGKTIPGWSLSRKDVSRVVIFPDKTISQWRRQTRGVGCVRPVTKMHDILKQDSAQEEEDIYWTQIHVNHANSTPAVTSATDDTDIAIPSVRLSVRDTPE